MIYFIQAEDTPRGPVKIGFTEDIVQRLRLLQAGNPSTLHAIATMPGDLIRERELHKRFDAGRVRGEWFGFDTPGLTDLIEKALDDAYEHEHRGLRWCSSCGIELVRPPRTRVCGDACELVRKRAKTTAWRAARRAA